MKTPDLMLFEPNLGGHHAEFTCHILKSWLQDGDRGRLVAAVTAGLLEQQPGLSFGLNAPPQTSVAPLADPTPGNARSLWRKAIRNRDLLAAAIRRHRPKRLLAMYFDHLQLGMATGLRFPFPVEISGILFHPTLHYRSPDKLNARHAFQNLRKRLLLHAVARNPHLKTVFTLDPSAVPSLRRLGLNAIALPDPVTATIVSLSSQIELRNRLSIPQDRQVMLLFGALTSRKGVIQTLEALCLLEPVKARGLVLLMAGPLDPELQEDADRLSVLARSKGTLIIHHKSFVLSADIQTYFAISDLILAPYQRHFGSSAVLIRAALAGKPVISQGFGFMGEMVREHSLGQAIDSSRPDMIANAILTYLENRGINFSALRSAAYAEANTPASFCATIFSHISQPTETITLSS